jgi:hypothetical protein
MNTFCNYTPMEIIKAINLGLAFLLELILLVAVGYFGFTLHAPLYIKLLVGLGAPVLVGIVWGLFAAPKSERRLHQPGLTVLKLGLFGVGAVGGNTLLLMIWRQ